MENIGKTSSIVISATHDFPIARTLDGEYDNYYFSERIEDKNLLFDYKLKKGIVDQKNAIRILDYLEFPDEIISTLTEEEDPD